jgi:RNA polymerase sigma-70 factor (ECF subfamily)
MHEGCKRYFEKVSEYLDGDADSMTCEQIEEHLLDCPECRRCFDSLKKSVEVCRKSPRERVPEEVKQRLREALRRYRNGEC